MTPNLQNRYVVPASIFGRLRLDLSDRCRSCICFSQPDFFLRHNPFQEGIKVGIANVV